MAWQSAQLPCARLPAPHKMNSTVYHCKFQKLQMFKFCNRNKTPAMSINQPLIVVHFLHPIIEYHLVC